MVIILKSLCYITGTNTGQSHFKKKQAESGIYSLWWGEWRPPRGTFQDCSGQYPSPRRATFSEVSTGDSPTLADSFYSVFCGVTAPFFWVLVSTEFCLCPPRLESLFPLVLWKSCNQIPLDFKVRLPENPRFLVPLSDPQAGKPDVGFRTFTTVGEFLFYCCSLVCRSPTLWVWDLVLSWSFSSYNLTATYSLSFEVGCLFIWWIPEHSF